MTQEQNARLLQAYRAAIAAGQDGIADMLEDVILEKMRSSAYIPTTRGIRIDDGGTQVEPPWKVTSGPVTYGPDMVSLGGKMECTGIDHLSKETTA